MVIDFIECQSVFFPGQIFYPDLINKQEAPEYFLVGHFTVS